MTMAVDVLADITTKVAAVTEFGQKIFAVYSETDLLDKTKMIRMPCVGIMYEGLVANGGDRSGQGMMADLRVALVLILDRSTGSLDRNNEAARLLDLIRQQIRMTRPTTQHKWSFLSEAPAEEIANMLIYVQRWSTPVALTN